MAYRREPYLSARILVVDDEAGNLVLLQHMLEREGYRNTIATPDPREVLDLHHALGPDLILLDLNMPGMDGFDVMNALGGVISADEFLPILVITGDSSPETRMRALSSGATDFVTKPFDRVEIMLRIHNLLHTRSLHAAAREQNRRLEALVAERTRELEIALLRAEAAGEAKTLFLAKMSHELRTPLTPLQGALELLTEIEMPPSSARLLQMAVHNTRRMVVLVNDILYLQEVEQGDVMVQPGPVHLAPLLQEVVREAEGGAPQRPVELRVDVPPGLLPLDTDAGLLMKALRRLVENAIRFTPAGTVTLRVICDDATRAPARIDVVDTGVGIPADRRVAVFQPFEQADNSNTRRYEGAGIGLTICRTLCDLLGYRLSLESEVGRGSTFSIAL